MSKSGRPDELKASLSSLPTPAHSRTFDCADRANKPFHYPAFWLPYPHSRAQAFSEDALKRRYRRKETTAAAIGAMASPILAVGAWQGFFVGDGFFVIQQLEAGITCFDCRGWNHEAVFRAAAPFAILGPAKASA